MKEKNYVILLAEDEKKSDSEFSLKEEIGKLKGISIVESVQGGKEALEKIKGDQYSILLTDDSLSDMDSRELVKRIVANGFKVPLIMLVDPGHEDIAAEAIKVGADDYVVKEKGYLKILPKIIEKTVEKFKLTSSLKLAEERYIQIFEHASDSIFICDIEGNILDVNTNACQWLGYKKDELLEMSMEDILSPAGKEKTSDIIQKIKGVKKSVFESSYIKKDGTAVPVELSASFFKLDKNEIILTFARDISKRKKIEKDLKLLANITTHTAEGIISVDERENITSWNRGAEIIFGYKSEEIIGKPYSILVPKESIQGLANIIREVYEKGFVSDIESERVTKDGQKIDVHLTTSIIKDEKGNKIGRSVILRDIAERKNMEEELIRSSKLASLGTLAAGIAHEFNNILTAMLGYAELGLITKDLEKMKKALEVVVKSSARAKSITDNLLTFARKHESKREYANIRDAVDTSIALVKREFEKDNIRIIRKFSKVSKTFCDVGQISHVCLNLLTNARDAMRPKGGKLIVELRNRDGYIELKFIDTGCGISPKLKERIFEPFITTKGPLGGSSEKGTGLGLSVSYGIIRNHNGTIEVKSKENKGSVFTIRLPIIKATLKDIKFLYGKKLKRVSRRHPLLKILVVDDEKGIRNLFEEILKREGHFINTKKSGRAALSLLRKEKFDLIFTDITMPGIDGIDFLKKVKKIDEKAKVVMVTGQVVDDDINLALAEGAFGFIRKPFTTSSIFSMIDEAISKDR